MHMKALVLLRDSILTVTAVLGVVTLLVLGAALLLNVKPLVVVSGSMEPGIPTGSLILSQKVPVGDLEVGDVVTVPKRAGNELVTHRIVRIEDAEVGRELVLRGDANDTDDPYGYAVESAGQHLVTLPGAGYAVAFVQSRSGTILVGATVAVVVILLVGTRGETREARRRGVPRHARSAES